MLDVRNAPVNVYLSAGSNIAPEQNLKMACQELASEYGELTVSSVYQNAAVGFAGEDFLNMVIGFSIVFLNFFYVSHVLIFAFLRISSARKPPILPRKKV